MYDYLFNPGLEVADGSISHHAQLPTLWPTLGLRRACVSHPQRKIQ